MTIRRPTTTILALAVVVCLAAAVATVRKLDRMRPTATLEETLYVPSPKVLKRLSLGYEGLLADVYWTRAVQYFGRRHIARVGHYELLAPLLEITTQLDPHLLTAYEFGSVFLAQQRPEGAGMPDKAIELVERGIRENPDDWHLYYDLGFIQYMEKKNYTAAADAFRRGSEVPGAHPWLRILAARMAQHGGDLQTARFLWSKAYEGTKDKMIRVNAVAHLRALDNDEFVPKLEELTRAFLQRTGHYPTSWQELIQAGWLRSVPMDPVGHAYKLVPGGKVEVAVPQDLPFITEGLPPGVQASTVPKLESNQ